MINWKVRINNKAFWIALIPTLVVLVQNILKVFGVTLELSELSTNLVAVIDIVFVLLSILGVINDPTTAGLSDSTQAMTYETPKVSTDEETDDEDGVG